MRPMGGFWTYSYVSYVRKGKGGFGYLEASFKLLNTIPYRVANLWTLPQIGFAVERLLNTRTESLFYKYACNISHLPSQILGSYSCTSFSTHSIIRGVCEGGWKSRTGDERGRWGDLKMVVADEKRGEE